MRERHRIYSLLLMSVLLSQWNGNKYGETGDYAPWRAKQKRGTLPDGTNVYSGGTYLGHNIAALAVDGDGNVIDFEFNHNDLFDSSVEHAESRLVRRVFALNQVYDPRTAQAPALVQRSRDLHVFATAVTDRAEYVTPPDKVLPYSTLLSDVTIYTSLESCAQCSGIMCLASIKEVVYLQWDQGQFLVGNIMYNATRVIPEGFASPRPVRGDAFDLDYFARLNHGNDAFTAAMPTTPFYTNGTTTKATPSVTSYLCTDDTLQVYTDAAAEFGQWSTATHPAYVPTGASPTALTNQQALDGASSFLAYVLALANRGTPHRI